MCSKVIRQLIRGRAVDNCNRVQRTLSFNLNELVNRRSLHLAFFSSCKKGFDSSECNESGDVGSNDNIEAKSHENEADRNHPHLQEIIDTINRGHRMMICMRGVPGSGKTRLARIIVDRALNCEDYSNHIFSADDYFYDEQTRQYNYDRSRVREAHKSNALRVARHAQSGWSPIIIDNTNMKLWEMFAYVKEGIRNGYVIRILEPGATWTHSVDELAQRNKHNVDQETIKQMRSRYEPGSVDDILNALNLQPARPRFRNFPKIFDPNDE